MASDTVTDGSRQQMLSIFHRQDIKNNIYHGRRWCGLAVTTLVSINVALLYAGRPGPS